MSDPFVHLTVASGYSLQYGASHPHVLVERAVEHEMDSLALTDRNGVYGAVRFAKACAAAGVRPILGVDLAFSAEPPPIKTTRTPARGGAYRDARLPRISYLASGKAGWAALCRLVSAVHHQGRTAQQGDPIVTFDLIEQHLANAGEHVLVLHGPHSPLGGLIGKRREDLAAAELARWRSLLPRENLVIDLVSHRMRGSGPGTSAHAARMLGWATSVRHPVVLSNAVRYADRLDAPVVDVLDAARRLVPMDTRHLDRGNAEGYLKSGKQMHEIAEEICRLAGQSEGAATALLASTRKVADRCALDPRGDLGLGEIHFPVLTDEGDADRVLRARCEAQIPSRYADAPRQRIWKRLDDELQIISSLGYASYFLTVGEVTQIIRDLGIRSAARGSGAGSLVNYLLGVSGVDPIRHGLLMERFLSPLRQSLPDVDLDVESARRLEVYDAIFERFGPERTACVSMMETYRVRHAIRDVGGALGMPLGEIDTIAKAFPHIRARDARMAMRDLPELRGSGLDAEQFQRFFGLVERLDGLPRHIAMHPCGVILSDA
ncbi:MAG TPA: PHP domain-containing protein, partial [Marmoricola sp.]|nr:PHP domain-containing protein [Marmoricola sp.]